jgi:hypothetical protein
MKGDAAEATTATSLDEGHFTAPFARCIGNWLRRTRLANDADSGATPSTRSREWLAMRPNEVWSRDISKLKGPAKWTCFHLYVILDIFSRTMERRQSVFVHSAKCSSRPAQGASCCHARVRAGPHCPMSFGRAMLSLAYRPGSPRLWACPTNWPRPCD